MEMQHQLKAKFKSILLRPLEERDILHLMDWRNDPANSRYLTPMEQITPQKQLAWFNAYLKDANSIIFAIEETSAICGTIGSVALYDFQKDAAEFGKFMIGHERARGKGYGATSAALCVLAGLKKLGMATIVLHVDSRNVAAIKVYENVGFVSVCNAENAGEYNNTMMINRELFYEKNIWAKAVEIEGNVNGWAKAYR